MSKHDPTAMTLRHDQDRTNYRIDSMKSAHWAEQQSQKGDYLYDELYITAARVAQMH